MVKKKPRIGIIPTGDELIEPGEKIFPGKIIEYNSKIIKNMVSEWGGEVLVHGVAIMPGKPTILGIMNNAPVIGLLGYQIVRAHV